MNATITLRLPVDCKHFLADQAARNGSSQNSEIVRCIRDRMEKLATTGVKFGDQSPAVAGDNNRPGDD